MTFVTSRLAQLSLKEGVQPWLVELLHEANADTSSLGMPRVSPMFSRLADTVDEDRGDRDEVRAVRLATRRLVEEWPDEAKAIERLMCPTPIIPDMELAASGARRLARWVDETMDGGS